MTGVKNKVSSEQLDTDHRNAFSRAIKTILASDLAEITMAQLVDGLPLADIAWKARGSHLTRAHPLTDHEKLCTGALEKIRSLRDDFDLDTLSFEPNLFQAYSDADMGSKDFSMRLIEMVAVSVHEIAVALFNLVPKSHPPEQIKYVTAWQEPSGWEVYYGRRTWEEPLYPPPPTHFFHCGYRDFDLYPNGLADVAGYWAEDQILGGVVVFDRGQSGAECNDIFLHSGRSAETYRIWRLLKSQLAGLVDFLLGKTPAEGFSLPLTATDENRYRFDPWDAIALYHVFRNPWERRIPLEKPPERDVRSTGDYPELLTLFDKVDEAIREDRTVTLYDFPEIGVNKAQANLPTKPDRLWIYRHGGHVDEPLGSQRLPWVGPPEDGSKAEIIRTYGDDSFDEWFPAPSPMTDDSFVPLYRTPSPDYNDSECGQGDDEPLPNETPMGEILDQEVNTRGQNSTKSRDSGDAGRDNERDIGLTAPEAYGPDAEGVGREAEDFTSSGGAGPANSQ